MKTRKLQNLMVAVSSFTAVLSAPVMAQADNGTITNPLSSNTSTASGFVNHVVTYATTAVAALAGAWFLFHLWVAIMKLTSQSRQAQKREEAKSHLIHVAVAGVLAGAAGTIAGALYHLGGSF